LPTPTNLTISHAPPIQHMTPTPTPTLAAFQAELFIQNTIKV